ncbi:uncharacterized protein LOC131231195 [Magnolia sinica]|uniref:uncharacterized protein LOC131231195 n=1 Tax=Magnolia sinica TaxID=86752 RepID=UPI00265B60B7|nr:uncharacterized protein LOC131231195 [Magnolia sinica]XP_058083291.1 uncharacterized protein LOC131231195 [Magnolia sinica]
MAKRGGARNASTPGSGYQFANLREESSGKKEVKGSKGVSSILRIQHLQKLAIWAGGEVSIPPLGALFGHHLAANAEATGIPIDSSFFTCQGCETILQPGRNCTVRIKKNTAKMQRHKKSCVPSKNNVVYTCHFCSHQSLHRGTPEGHMKEIFASRPKLISDSKQVSSTDKKSIIPEKDTATGAEIIYLKPNPLSESKSKSPKKEKDQAVGEITIENSPATPFKRVGSALSVEKKWKRCRSGPKKTVGNENSSASMETGKATSGSSKRRRKAWSSLKEIAENNERESAREIGNLTIPFHI